MDWCIEITTDSPISLKNAGQIVGALPDDLKRSAYSETIVFGNHSWVAAASIVFPTGETWRVRGRAHEKELGVRIVDRLVGGLVHFGHTVVSITGDYPKFDPNAPTREQRLEELLRRALTYVVGLRPDQPERVTWSNANLAYDMMNAFEDGEAWVAGKDPDDVGINDILAAVKAGRIEGIGDTTTHEMPDCVTLYRDIFKELKP